MRVCDLEGHVNWKQIVESVVCPDCGSPSGIPCQNMRYPGTLYGSKPRTDWHQERKFLAAAAWQMAMDRVTSEIPSENTAVDEVSRDQQGR